MTSEKNTKTITDSLIGRFERWLIPLWAVMAVIILFIIGQGVIPAYESRLIDADVLFGVPLEAWNLPLAFYPIYLLTLEFSLIAIAMGTGLYLLLIARNNRMAILASFFMIIWVVTWVLPYIEAQKQFPLQIAVIDVVGNFLYTTLLLTFPTGRLQAKWVRWLLPGGFLLLFIVTPMNSLSGTLPTQGALLQLILYGAVAGAILLQVLRYRYHSTQEEKQQSKWVFLGFVASYAIPITFLTVDYFIAPFIIGNPYIRLIYRLINSTFFVMIPFALLPITMLIAITKSRLWEIDLLLNKATVTTGVTLTLLVIGGIGVGVLQALISNTIIAIVTMLVVVIVLYKPVRRTVQSLLDRQILGLRFDLDQLQQVQLSREITNRGQHSGLKLANVELLNVIDRGGMGEVYQGIWHERAVAIKTMLKKLAKEPIARKRFEREIRAGQLLSHPHIVKTLDSGAFDDIPYLVLEYIAGHTLKNYSENTPLSTDEALKIVCEVGDALAYLHQQGMVHRDIKPSNIMLRDAGSSVLIDFGLVKFAEDDTDLTGKAAIGTIDYMAPEQIKSAGTVDQRADVYALGILLYELLTGQTPFAGDAGQILFAHLTQPPPDLSDFGLGIPEYVSNAVQRALMKDPDDRYPSVSAFMDAVALPLAA